MATSLVQQAQSAVHNLLSVQDPAASHIQAAAPIQFRRLQPHDFVEFKVRPVNCTPVAAHSLGSSLLGLACLLQSACTGMCASFCARMFDDKFVIGHAWNLTFLHTTVCRLPMLLCFPLTMRTTSFTGQPMPWTGQGVA